jgi:hypothetical protein
MNPLEEPQPGELLEIATNRVLGDPQPRHELGNHDSAVAAEASEYVVSTLRGQHLLRVIAG